MVGMKRKSVFLLIFISFLSVAARGADLPAFGKIPLIFEANRGQADNGVKFLARGPGYGIFLTENEAVLRLMQPSAAEVRMSLVGRRPESRLEAMNPLPGKTHYLTGSNADGWHGDLPTYGQVRHSGVY